jgi:predicted DNA binding CopG/RHH family protein
MKKKSELGRQLSALAPNLEEVEPGFRVPEFKTEEEEIAWLDSNYERLADLTLKHGRRVKLALKEPTRQISIRLPVRDVERAKEIAGKEKVNYQSVVKRALRRGLQAEGSPSEKPWMRLAGSVKGLARDASMRKGVSRK